MAKKTDYLGPKLALQPKPTHILIPVPTKAIPTKASPAGQYIDPQQQQLQDNAGA